MVSNGQINQSLIYPHIPLLYCLYLTQSECVHKSLMLCKCQMDFQFLLEDSIKLWNRHLCYFLSGNLTGLLTLVCNEMHSIVWLSFLCSCAWKCLKFENVGDHFLLLPSWQTLLTNHNLCIISVLQWNRIFLGSSTGKEPTCYVGDLGSILWLELGRSPGGSQRVKHDWATKHGTALQRNRTNRRQICTKRWIIRNWLTHLWRQEVPM